MNENKGTTVLLTVIGIATLLVAVVGATFAYFTAQVTDVNKDNTDITVNAATLGTITFTHGNVIDLCDDSLTACDVIYPGAQEAKEFYVKADDKASVAVDYVVYLQISENTFITDNLGYKISATTEDGTAALPEGATRTASTDLPTAAATYTSLNSNTITLDADNLLEIGRGTLGTYGAKDTWNLDVMLANLDTEQNDDQNKKFTATIVVKADTKYTTDENGNVTVYDETQAGA